MFSQLEKVQTKNQPTVAIKWAIRKVLSFGYKVYIYPSDHIKYFFFSDGKSIGYIQERFDTEQVALCTQHKPNIRVGTSFYVDDCYPVSLTKELLSLCFKDLGPNTKPTSIMFVEKYKDLEEFLGFDEYNQQLVEYKQKDETND